jgi:hypothetical protein
VLLGHSSIKVTEKHYSLWVLARQEQLEADVRRTWEGSLLETKSPREEDQERASVSQLNGCRMSSAEAMKVSRSPAATSSDVAGTDQTVSDLKRSLLLCQTEHNPRRRRTLVPSSTTL